MRNMKIRTIAFSFFFVLAGLFSIGAQAFDIGDQGQLSLTTVKENYTTSVTRWKDASCGTALKASTTQCKDLSTNVEKARTECSKAGLSLEKDCPKVATAS